MSRYESQSKWIVTGNDTFDQPIIGEIDKIAINSGQWGNGSLFILTSGTNDPNEIVLSSTGISGTSASVKYPRRIPENNAGDSLSGLNYDKYMVNQYIQLGTSGTTANKSGLVTLYYKIP